MSFQLAIRVVTFASLISLPIEMAAASPPGESWQSCDTVTAALRSASAAFVTLRSDPHATTASKSVMGFPGADCEINRVTGFECQWKIDDPAEGETFYTALDNYIHMSCLAPLHHGDSSSGNSEGMRITRYWVGRRNLHLSLLYYRKLKRIKLEINCLNDTDCWVTTTDLLNKNRREAALKAAAEKKASAAKNEHLCEGVDRVLAAMRTNFQAEAVRRRMDLSKNQSFGGFGQDVFPGFSCSGFRIVDIDIDEEDLDSDADKRALLRCRREETIPASAFNTDEMVAIRDRYLDGIGKCLDPQAWQTDTPNDHHVDGDLYSSGSYFMPGHHFMGRRSIGVDVSAFHSSERKQFERAVEITIRWAE